MIQLDQWPERGFRKPAPKAESYAPQNKVPLLRFDKRWGWIKEREISPYVKQRDYENQGKRTDR
jgi:hypothetical protein